MHENDSDNFKKMLNGWEAFVTETHPAVWCEDEDGQKQVVYSQVVELHNFFANTAGFLEDFQYSLGSVGPDLDPKDIVNDDDLVLKSALWKLDSIRHELFVMLDNINDFAKKFGIKE
jgi:hypothetical protein